MIKLSYEQQIAFNSLSIIVGNALYALTVVLFLVPSGLITGGATGIALGINRALGLPVSGVLFVINMTMLAVGWVLLGRRFAVTTVASTILSPLFLALWERVFADFVLTDDLVLNTIFAGLGVGISLGITSRAGTSTGGMDIPPCILQKYFGIPVGTSLMAFDTATVGILVCFRGVDELLYSLLIIALMSITINRAVVMGEQKIEIIIISPDYQRIRQEVLEKINCGVTMLNIETGYEGEAQKAILSVVYAKKYPEIRDAALRIDSKAFIVANEVMNVNGRGYTFARNENER